MSVVSASLPTSSDSRGPVGVSGRALRRRRLWNGALWAGCGLALALVVIPVVWIMVGIVGRAASHWQWSVLTTTTQGTGGGLLNAIVGTFVIVL
ncbi:MAG TPA: hypothetical protein VED63_09705, partial [Acidimicrobiales bacterium]|nr:hypothetical protein [Acidimicrobiales bacterium]